MLIYSYVCPCILLSIIFSRTYIHIHRAHYIYVQCTCTQINNYNNRQVKEKTCFSWIRLNWISYIWPKNNGTIKHICIYVVIILLTIIIYSTNVCADVQYIHYNDINVQCTMYMRWSADHRCVRISIQLRLTGR